MGRIAIIGVTGAGKTTLAFNMAARLGLPYTDLDDLYWLPEWQHTPLDEFRTKVDEATSQKNWIITGNYPDIRDMLWDRADTLVWLDYSFGLSLSRLLKRTVSRVIDQKPVCNGNTETLAHVFSKESIIPWFFATYGPRKKENDAIFNSPDAWPHLNKIRLRSQKETDEFLKNLAPAHV